MATPNITTMGGWVTGANSLLHPTLIPKTSYHNSENCINRGGVVQTRPGFKLALNRPGSRLQGLTSFLRLESDIPYLVMAIDGKIYVSQFPFDVVTQLTELNFSPDVEMVFFEECVQSVKLNRLGHLEVINPKKILVIQDGVTRAGTWDGTTARHVNPEPPEYGPPIGTWMKWIGSRLWIASGTQMIVSDYANPEAFSENIYLAERSNFQLPDIITGLLATPDQKNLLVFTRYVTTSFQASIAQRNLWQETPNFQQELIPDIGCVAGRSCLNLYGSCWWYAEQGLIDLNAALFSQRDSELKFHDNEMARTKIIMSHNTDGVCSAYFENLMMIAVPAGGMLNNQIMVMDGGVVDLPSERLKAWSGVWTGIAPKQFAALYVSGERKVYAGCQSLTQHEGNVIQIWEMMRNDKLDNGNPMVCQFETRCEIIDGMFYKMGHFELDLCEVLGDVHLKGYYAGIKGGYEQILDVRLTAEKGSIGGVNQEILFSDTVMESYKPQTRTVRSEEVAWGDGSDNQAECAHVESERTFNIDKGFGILLEWEGQMGVRAIRLYTEQVPATDTKGKCEPDETGNRILTVLGKSVAIGTE